MSVDVEALAATLDAAVLGASAVPQLSAQHALTLAEAYEVQRAGVARRLARGERRIGVKMGFTSRAKMEQMGLSDLVWGRLTDGMIVEDGGRVARARFVHPRVEPEVAFLLGRDLAGQVTLPQALAAVAAVAPALEIIDSRYRDFRFSLPDVVADNTSASAFVVGPWHAPGGALDNLGLVLAIDGRPRAYGSSAAILGEPLRALVAAARLAGAAGEVIRAGDLVLAGGATAALALEAGMHVQLELQRLGRASFTLV